MTTTVNGRFALLQEVQRHIPDYGYTAECFGRSLGVVALGSVLVPLISSQSPDWHQRSQEMTLADWFALLVTDQAYDRFRYGALARNSIALGLLIGDQSEKGDLSVVVEAIRPPKSDGVVQALWSRLKGMSNAPKDALVDDFGAWIDGQGKQAVAGAKVKISEQSLRYVCQWVDALNNSEMDSVVDGSVWSTILAQLDVAAG